MPKLAAQSAFRYPLSTVFSGQVAVRISREIFLHGGPLTVRELAARTGATRKSVYLAVDSLLALGLVHRVGSAQTGLFQIVEAHPLAPYLGGLFGAEDKRVQAVYDAVRRGAKEARPSPIAIWLYGSVARGEDTPSSDLDLTVCADENEVEAVVDAIRAALRPAGERLFVRFSVIGLSPRDILRMDADSDPFWTRLVSDARALSGPGPEDVLRLHRRHHTHSATP